MGSQWSGSFSECVSAPQSNQLSDNESSAVPRSYGSGAALPAHTVPYSNQNAGAKVWHWMSWLHPIKSGRFNFRCLMSSKSSRNMSIGSNTVLNFSFSCVYVYSLVQISYIHILGCSKKLWNQTHSTFLLLKLHPLLFWNALCGFLYATYSIAHIVCWCDEMFYQVQLYLQHLWHKVITTEKKCLSKMTTNNVDRALFSLNLEHFLSGSDVFHNSYAVCQRVFPADPMWSREWSWTAFFSPVPRVQVSRWSRTNEFSHFHNLQKAEIYNGCCSTVHH